MAFRRRRVFSRRRGFRGRAGARGSRWAPAGSRGGRVVRSKREWTGYYEDPPCGGLVPWVPTQTDGEECWTQQDTLVLGGLTATGDDNESTLVAFKGWFQPWAEVGAVTIGGAGGFGVQAQFITGLGFGLQLVPFRDGNPYTPRIWSDNDNSDWLVRKWYPSIHVDRGAIQILDPPLVANLMPMFDEESMQIDITQRRVDWSEWALYMSIAMSAQEAIEDPIVGYQFQGRLMETFVGGNSAIG